MKVGERETKKCFFPKFMGAAECNNVYGVGKSTFVIFRDQCFEGNSIFANGYWKRSRYSFHFDLFRQLALCEIGNEFSIKKKIHLYFLAFTLISININWINKIRLSYYLWLQTMRSSSSNNWWGPSIVYSRMSNIIKT